MTQFGVPLFYCLTFSFTHFIPPPPFSLTFPLHLPLPVPSLLSGDSWFLEHFTQGRSHVLHHWCVWCRFLCRCGVIIQLAPPMDEICPTKCPKNQEQCESTVLPLKLLDLHFWFFSFLPLLWSTVNPFGVQLILFHWPHLISSRTDQ